MSGFDFIYREFFYRRGSDDKGTRWERLSEADIAKRVAKVGGVDCFATIQTFATIEQVEGEAHYAPPYADFDAPDLETGLRDVALLTQFARDELDMEDDDIQVFFSGKKGFHVLFNPLAFGVEPSPDLTYVYKRMFGHLREYLGLTSLDGVVYTRKRQLRIINTKHSSTGLHKVWLNADEATLDAESITELAAEPRETPPAWPKIPSPAAQEFLRRFVREHEAEVEAKKHAPVELRFDAVGDPVCVQDIMAGGIKKDGDRNKATMVLASYFKDRGASETAVTDTLTPWAKKLKWRHPDDRHVEANTTNTIKAVYDSDDYHFGCAFIRSLHGDKRSPDYERVACAGSVCPFVHKIEKPDTIDLHLSDIGKPEIVEAGAKVRTRICVAGKTESPFVLPRTVEVSATVDTDDCDKPGCELHAVGGRMTLDIYERDLRLLIGMINVNDKTVDTIIRTHIQAKSCKHYTFRRAKLLRAIEFVAIPMAASRHDDVPEVEGNYTYQTCYALGVEDLDLSTNAYYEVTGYAVNHPKSQAAVLAITHAETLQDVIETFDIDGARAAFSVYDSVPLAERASTLLQDVTHNVTRIFKRDYETLALLMTMHAPLHLEWDGETYGGWAQALVIGDTGQGKSQIVERLLHRIGLGDLASAQSASRTGLLYSINDAPHGGRILQWGALVLNDRRLLVVDEASGIDRDEWAQMRNARRDGIMKVQRAVTGEAPTRTRLIMLSNPRHGQTMSMESSYGIGSIEQLFEAADIRRFDLVIGFRHGRIKPDDIAPLHGKKVPHRFTADVLRANMLWAWSRRPEHIIWQPGTREAVREQARALNKKYDNLGKITLLGPDAEEKVARLSQAFAATLHSTDETHANVVVTPDIVNATGALIDYIYSSPDLEFDLYARNQGTDDVDYPKLLTEIETEIAAPDYRTSYGVIEVDFDEVMGYCVANQYVDKWGIEAVLDDGLAAKRVWKVLTRRGLVRRIRGGTVKSPHFNEVLRLWARRKDAEARATEGAAT